MSQRRLASFSKTSYLVGLFVVLCLQVLGLADQGGEHLPRIRKVVLSAESSIIQHEYSGNDSAFQIRINVLDVNSPVFRHECWFENCKIVPPPADHDMASTLYPKVARLDGTDLDLHRDELIKVAIGKRVVVTRTTLAEVATDEGTQPKSKSVQREDIHGTLLGFKGESNAYAIQLLSDNQEMFYLESKDIAQIQFVDEGSELSRLSSQLRRQSEFSLQTMMLSKGDPVAVVGYSQPTVPGHEWQSTIFANLDSSGTSIDSEAWATIWNDTFYDWNGITVILKSDSKTEFALEDVHLRFGQKGLFRYSLPSEFEVRRQWRIEPPTNTASTTATINSVLEIKNKNKDVFIPKSTWKLRDVARKPVYDGTIEGMAFDKTKDIPYASDKVMPIAYASSDDVVQFASIQGNKLLCRAGTVVNYSFSDTKFQAEVAIVKNGNERGIATIVPERNGSFEMPDSILDPKPKGGKYLDHATKGSTLTIRSIASPEKMVSVDLFRATASQLMGLSERNKTLNDIIESKKKIEAVKNELAKYEAERNELVSRPPIGAQSGYRFVLQSEMAGLVERKNAEIQLKRDELAKAEFGLMEILRLLPKEAPPTPTELIEKLGGHVKSDGDGNLTEVYFAKGSDAAAAIEDGPLFDALNQSIATLTTLRLAGCSKIQGTRLADLGRSHIATLDLSGTSVSDDALNNFPIFFTLNELDLSNTGVTDKCSRGILRCKRLNSLNVDCTSFTKITPLSPHPTLTMISRRGTDLGDDDVGVFQKKRPDIRLIDSEHPPSNPVFADQSFWYNRVDLVDESDLDPNSALYVKEFLNQMAAGCDNHVGINTICYASPVYVANASSPKVKVTIDNSFGFDEQAFAELKKQMESVPFPVGAVPADGEDSEMTIFDPVRDTLWEFAQLKSTPQGWVAAWGGHMCGVKKNIGLFKFPFGATATGLPFVGGQITAEELDGQSINHAIGIAVVRAKKGERSWPALRDDGEGCTKTAECQKTVECRDEDLLMEGQRFRLAPSVDVETITHPVARTIARAAQQYGFVIWDKSATTSLRVKNPKSYTQIGQIDPYPELFGNSDKDRILERFPWDKIQFLKKDFGQPK